MKNVLFGMIVIFAIICTISVGKRSIMIQKWESYNDYDFKTLIHQYEQMDSCMNKNVKSDSTWCDCSRYLPKFEASKFCKDIK